MILDRLECADRYAGLNPYFEKAFDFLRQTRLEELAPGRNEIDGDRVYAMVLRGPGRSRDEARLEAHRKYIDIQVSLSGTDEIGWKGKSLCTEPDGDYDPGGDCELFTDTPDAWVAVGPGSFAVFFPEDAHAPMVADGELHKVVVKVACSL